MTRFFPFTLLNPPLLGNSSLLAIFIFWLEPLIGINFIILLLKSVPEVSAYYLGGWTPAKVTGFHDQNTYILYLWQETIF